MDAAHKKDLTAQIQRLEELLRTHAPDTPPYRTIQRELRLVKGRLEDDRTHPAALRFPVATLTNGVRVANFSSQHPFTFEDGTILDAVDSATASMGTVRKVEKKVADHGNRIDVGVDFYMTPDCAVALLTAQKLPGVDVIIVPLPVLVALRASAGGIGICRTCIITDRAKRICAIDRFGV